jgi:hypothetical protein
MSCTHICSPLDPVSQSLEIRQATTKFGIDQLRAALNDELYLMAGRPAGNTIGQGIYPTDPDDDWPVLCAVLCWSGAALRPNDRDEWISWDPLTRGRRLPLVTQLRRFLVLQSRRAPNLTTRCMGLALRKLPDHRSPLSRRYAKIGLLGLIAHGLLVGAPDVKAIWKRSTALSQDQRKAIGLNVRNDGGRLVMPSDDSINNFVNGVDPQALADALNQWLTVHQDKLPKSLVRRQLHLPPDDN